MRKYQREQYAEAFPNSNLKRMRVSALLTLSFASIALLFSICNGRHEPSVAHAPPLSGFIRAVDRYDKSNADGATIIEMSSNQDGRHMKSYKKWELWMLLTFGVGVGVLFMAIIFICTICKRCLKKNSIVKAGAESPPKSPRVESEEKRSELVFFVEKEEWFELDELLESEADLRAHGFCTSLYIVRLKNDSVFAVKRLKKLRVSFEEFGMTMRRIGNLKHPNILPLVCYNSTPEEKLLVYRYQSNGSLLDLFENYVEGKIEFPWKRRLSIKVGIARGLNYIYGDSQSEIIPHGNLKPSNIMLSDNNEEPLISEYGYAKFLDPSRICLFSNGYSAPEKSLTQRADIYSFGVIMLELLTGKLVEKIGLDLPRWVRTKLREEWTGEVFDKEIESAEIYGFSLLNVALKCVANRPEERPEPCEVLEKIEEVVNACRDDDVSYLSIDSQSMVSPCPSISIGVGHN